MINNNKVFEVVCYKQDIGIFTGYGAKIKSKSHTPPPGPYPHPHDPNRPHYYPHDHCIPHDPRFAKRVCYEVVIFSNPDLTQSVTIYEDKDINKCRLVINNFMKIYLNGMRYIDLDTISDKVSIELHENINDRFDGFFPLWNEWDKHWCDPRKNRFYDLFDCEGPCAPNPTKAGSCVDCTNTNIPDGDTMSFNANNEVSNCTCNHTIPNTYDRIYKEHSFPNECRHPHFYNDIVFYFGNGGFYMGGSVKNSIVEMSEYALHDMYKRNGYPTYHCMNPRDTIHVEQYIKDTITIKDTFTTRMDCAGEWLFIAIPDKYYKLISKFNWYYRDPMSQIDSSWHEAPLEMSEKTFTIQSNKVRYFVNAIRFDNDYQVRFAKSNLLPDLPDDTDCDCIHPDECCKPNPMKYRVTISIDDDDTSIAYHTLSEIDNGVESTPIKLNMDMMHSTWCDFETSKKYVVKAMKTSVGSEELTPSIVTYLKVIENNNFKKGFSLWSSNNDTNYQDLKSDTFSYVKRTVQTEMGDIITLHPFTIGT